jgi:N-acetylglutamate synthase-like GNAT family acetyltransferase|tara:strand:- start:11378 stop:11821 length:444 start_codon:yes stop_codon:yes gene_type:complete
MIRLSNFEEVHKIWTSHLWPQRENVAHMTSMTYLGGHDTEIYAKYKPTFFVYEIKGEIVGVNSCCKSATTQMRSRGLWVNTRYRRQGITYKLFNALFEEANIQECELVWSLPRKTAIKAYLANGFEKTSDWIKTDTSSANCYAVKML